MYRKYTKRNTDSKSLSEKETLYLVSKDSVIGSMTQEFVGKEGLVPLSSQGKTCILIKRYFSQTLPSASMKLEP